MADSHQVDAPLLPRVTIKYCTQCKWMLRAAYFAQELLSTFSTSLGEVSLQPSTGGTFIVTLTTSTSSTFSSSSSSQTHTLWDRKAQSGFPEVKELKRLVRDIIEPTRDLGHVDRHDRPPSTQPIVPASSSSPSEMSSSVPRPSEIAARAQALSHDRPPGISGPPAPGEEEGRWGSRGVGGMKPIIRPPPESAQRSAEQKLAARGGRVEAEAEAEAEAEMENRDLQRQELEGEAGNRDKAKGQAGTGKVEEEGKEKGKEKGKGDGRERCADCE